MSSQIILLSSKVILPEYKQNYANLEFRIFTSESDPNVRNSIQSEFPKTISTAYLVKLAN